MAEITERSYTVKARMRWDQVSLLAYGDAYRQDDLLARNQQLGVYNILPIGAVVICPILLDAAETPNPNDFPIWKQP